MSTSINNKCCMQRFLKSHLAFFFFAAMLPPSDICGINSDKHLHTSCFYTDSTPKSQHSTHMIFFKEGLKKKLKRMKPDIFSTSQHMAAHQI